MSAPGHYIVRTLGRQASEVVVASYRLQRPRSPANLGIRRVGARAEQRPKFDALHSLCYPLANDVEQEK